MTVTDLVRDTCKSATLRVHRGETITVKSGKKTLFRIVPSPIENEKMTARRYRALVKELQKIADSADLDKNPIVKMRMERR